MCDAFASNERLIFAREGRIEGDTIRQQVFCPILIDRIFPADECVCFGGWEFQDRGTDIARDNIAFVLRIQCPQLLQIQVQNVGDLLQMKHLPYHDRIGSQWQIGLQRADIMVAIIVHDIVGSDEKRDIRACFLGQIRKDIPEICFSPGTADGFVHIPRSTIIGRQDEVPVFVDGIHIFEIEASGFRSFRRVASVIYQTVDFQTIAFPRRKHELP